MATRKDAAKKMWDEHCQSALRDFVSTAVVIDNEPCLSEHVIAKSSTTFRATMKDEGMPPADESYGAAAPQMESDEADNHRMSDSDGSVEQEDLGVHRLNIRATSDAFAKAGILCSFVLPLDEEVESQDISRRVLQAAKQADIVVVDWYLKGKDSVAAQKMLERIAENDVDENGRLRLICIYTGQTEVEDVLDGAVGALLRGGLELGKQADGTALGAHHCLVVMNKQKVPPEKLPEELLEKMAILTKGLLPSFGLASVAAIRRNVHHIVTQFPEQLDGPFVANRLISDPPEGMVELMRELFLSECDSALDLAQVVRQHLSEEAISSWLETLTLTNGEYSNGDNPKILIDLSFMKALLAEGLDHGGFVTLDSGRVPFPEPKREKVSAVLCGTTTERDRRELVLARKVVMKREAFGSTKLAAEPEWAPVLTLGTILKCVEENGNGNTPRYYYCLTPACDTLRLPPKGVTLVMAELTTHREASGKYNLVVADEDGSPIKLYFSPKTKFLKAFTFDSVDNGQIRAESRGEHRFHFQSSGEPIHEFLWLGEVRRHRANRDMADLNRAWLRLGFNDSEYLRLKAKG